LGSLPLSRLIGVSAEGAQGAVESRNFGRPPGAPLKYLVLVGDASRPLGVYF